MSVEWTANDGQKVGSVVSKLDGEPEAGDESGGIGSCGFEVRERSPRWDR